MKPKGIIVHCSDSNWGSAFEIDKWHRQRGFDCIGYHFVIQNGYNTSNSYIDILDGMIEVGRSPNKLGAHAKGYNNYLGICLIGKKDFTENQFNNLKILINSLCTLYDLPKDRVIGHYDVSSKTCPNFNVKDFICK